MASQKTGDFSMARDLHEELNFLGVTENAVRPNKENYRPRTLIDQTLEFIDPTPNIYTLFVQFNERFFWNVLLPVEVKWSNRMTSCAGTCSFHRRNKQCIITLSAPLLKLRPRKDLVETLLHEMIHGYLFLTNNDRDRDGHGPNFCKHMKRINKEAGTNITIYHNFHDEVKLYKQHWWKCNGPCQNRPPFFGMVRRAMNRAPCPADFWWDEHKANCNGQFIKIKEPDNFKSHPKRNDKSKLIDKTPNRNIANWFTKTNIPKPISSLPQISSQTNNTNIKKGDNYTSLSQIINEKSNKDLPLGIKKVGSTSNNVHGWGTSGPSNKAERDNTKSIISKSPQFSYSGTLGGSNTGQSNLLNKPFYIKNDKTDKNSLHGPIKKDSPSAVDKNPVDTFFGKSGNDLIFCPICNISILLEDINKHIDLCLINDQSKQKFETNTSVKLETKSLSVKEHNNSDKLSSPVQTHSASSVNEPAHTNINPGKRLKLDDLNESKYVSCPICNKMLLSADINQHLDECLLQTDKVHKIPTSGKNHVSNNDDVIYMNSSSDSDQDNSVIIKNPKNSISHVNTNNSMNVEQKCLVCNTQIAFGISLIEHLEECIGPIFNDDNNNDDDDDDDNDQNDQKIENKSMDNKYPCPVCMSIISENLMNQHLDMCLRNE